MDEIYDFQLTIAKKEEVKVGRSELTEILKDFVCQMHSAKHAAEQDGLSYSIDWPAFRNTLIEWLASNSPLLLTLMDQQGYLTEKDKMCLH
mmetsp:Transcript_13196/g.9552  ORF Transcript_13196/g.9552 Transcript_13196/m.9552 type:complete len:91 (-) Transcript_13196:8-280(-)